MPGLAGTMLTLCKQHSQPKKSKILMTGASGEHTSSLELVAAFPPQLEIMVAAAYFRAALLQGDSLLLLNSAPVYPVVPVLLSGIV